jgi:hypothetical protein
MTKTMHVIPSKGKEVVGLTMQKKKTQRNEREKKQANRNHHAKNF